MVPLQQRTHFSYLSFFSLRRVDILPPLPRFTANPPSVPFFQSFSSSRFFVSQSPLREQNRHFPRRHNTVWPSPQVKRCPSLVLPWLVPLLTSYSQSSFPYDFFACIGASIMLCPFFCWKSSSSFFWSRLPRLPSPVWREPSTPSFAPFRI